MLNFSTKHKTTEEIIKETLLTENQDLKNTLETLKHTHLYISLIFIDLTFLNKKYTMTFGTNVKQLILQQLQHEKQKGEITHISVTSSKIFIFSHNILNSNLMKQINLQTYQFVNNYISKNNLEPFSKEILFIVTQQNNKHFKIGPYNNLFELINKSLFIEKNLTNYREITKQQFKQPSPTKKQIEQLQNTQNNLNSLENNNKYPQILTPTNSTPNKIKNTLKNYKKELKNSTYLTNSLKTLLNITTNGYDTPYFLNIALEETIKYLLWFQMQKLQFIGFKIEKIYTYFNRTQQNNSSNENRKTQRFTKHDSNIIKIKTQKDLQNWYDSTIKYFLHLGLTKKQQTQATQIQQLISNSKTLNPETEKELSTLILNFFDNLQLRGTFNVPLEKISITQPSIELLKNIFYNRYKTNYKTQIEKWTNQDFIIKKFPLYIKDPKLFHKGLNYIYGQNQWQSKHIHIIFLEIDGFNSFNTFYFPNDTDTIIYNQILETISKTILKQQNKLPAELFNNYLSSFLGDEFFFCFSTNEKLSFIQKNKIKKLFTKIQTKIKKICKQINFPETEKINIQTKNDNIIFRKITENKNELKIAQISVSGTGITNRKYNANYQNPETFFEHLTKDIENSMDNIKQKHKGKFKWDC